jgi:hypothetical protein
MGAPQMSQWVAVEPRVAWWVWSDASAIESIDTA